MQNAKCKIQNSKLKMQKAVLLKVRLKLKLMDLDRLIHSD